VAVVEASWNWPRGQKELDIYGTDAELHLPDRDTLTLRQGAISRVLSIPQTAAEPQTPVAQLVAVARGTLKPSGPSALGYKPAGNGNS
jgi:hypothetical protein